MCLRSTCQATHYITSGLSTLSWTYTSYEKRWPWASSEFSTFRRHSNSPCDDKGAAVLDVQRVSTLPKDQADTEGVLAEYSNYLPSQPSPSWKKIMRVSRVVLCGTNLDGCHVEIGAPGSLAGHRRLHWGSHTQRVLAGWLGFKHARLIGKRKRKAQQMRRRCCPGQPWKIVNRRLSSAKVSIP